MEIEAKMAIGPVKKGKLKRLSEEEVAKLPEIDRPFAKEAERFTPVGEVPTPEKVKSVREGTELIRQREKRKSLQESSQAAPTAAGAGVQVAIEEVQGRVQQGQGIIEELGPSEPTPTEPIQSEGKIGAFQARAARITKLKENQQMQFAAALPLAALVGSKSLGVGGAALAVGGKFAAIPVAVTALIFKSEITEFLTNKQKISDLNAALPKLKTNIDSLPDLVNFNVLSQQQAQNQIRESELQINFIEEKLRVLANESFSFRTDTDGLELQLNLIDVRNSIEMNKAKLLRIELQQQLGFSEEEVEDFIAREELNSNKS